MKFRNKIIKLKACPEAVEWVGDRDFATAWRECKRADWMLWLAPRLEGQHGITRKGIILAACACAETALQYVPEGEHRPRMAIEAARKCANDNTTDNRDAAGAAGVAAWTTKWTTSELASRYAARAAVSSALTTTGDLGYVGLVARHAMWAATGAATSYDAKAAALAHMADLVRAELNIEGAKKT